MVPAMIALRSMCVDCELLEGSTVGEELALKIPKLYSKRAVAGVLLICTVCEPAMCKMDRIAKTNGVTGRGAPTTDWRIQLVLSTNTSEFWPVPQRPKTS